MKKVKSMPRSAETSVSEPLRKLAPRERAIVKAARRMVRAAAPKATEIAYRSRRPRSSRSMWKIVHYAVDDAYVVGIGTFPTYASIFFYRGRELDDGSGVLEGAGKTFRSIKLHAAADAEQPALKRIVRQAFKLGGVSARRVRRE